MTTIIQNYTTKNLNINTDVAIVTLTEKSILASNKISDCFIDADIFVTQKHSEKIKTKKNIIFYDKLSDIIELIFKKYNAVIFIMATGIVIRHIAPYIIDKTKDPAVIVCDEKLNFAISLLSGHLGGANEICNKLSDKIDITPVVTTATDVNKKAALDIIVKKLGAFDDAQRDYYKRINYKLSNDEKIYLLSDIDISSFDTRGFTIITENEIDYISNMYYKKYENRNIISYDKIDFNKSINTKYDIIHITNKKITSLENIQNYKKIHPRNIALGIGCKKNTPVDTMIELVYQHLTRNNISEKSVRVIGSINLKNEEKAIIELANELGCDFVTYSSEEIKSSNYYKSVPKNEFVCSITGVNSVSLSVAKILSDDNLIGDTYRGNGVTVTIGKTPMI